MQTINVNTEHKAKEIISILKASGRTAFYEQFATYEGFFYTIFYRGI